MLTKIIQRYLNFKKGQGFIEYAFILMLIALMLIVSIGSLGQQILEFFNSVPNEYLTNG